MKKTRQEKGITLIALIISIIILLILAIVTIDAVMEDKIIAKAEKASEDYKSEASKEEVVLGNHLGQLDKVDQSSSGGAGGDSTLTKYTRTTQVKDDNGDTYWVPAGYSVVKDNTTNSKALVDEGLVIQDDKGNQWVWVPATVSEISEVVDGKNVGKLYNFTSTGATSRTYSTESYHEVDVYSNTWVGNDSDEYAESDEQLKAQLQSEFNSMIESVEEYGGYYIARYEIGGTTAKPVVKKDVSVLDRQGWETMYNTAKKLGANDSVTTGMIWGCQWDNTLRWLVSNGNTTWEEIVNSKHWGNYDLSEYDFGYEDDIWVENTYWDDTMWNYTDNTYGDWNTTGEWVTQYIPGADDEYTPPTGQGTLCTSGSSDIWKVGNIYDLAGNAGEWTLTTHTSEYSVEYCLRGGDYGEGWEESRFSVAYICYGNYPFYGTTRATLIINVD